MSARRARFRSDESGFTLIELVLVMTITALVITPIASAMFLGLRTEGDVQQRLSESNGAMQFSSYFGPDVQQALLVGVNTAESGTVCGANPLNVNLLLTLVPGQSSVSYYVDPANTKILRRRTCESGAVTGPPGGIPVIRNLAAAPTFVCSPNADCSNWQTVSATIQQAVSGNNPYNSTVQASRRIS
jgi:prepilin-type N-terminal cleavage/methylation domain-containing protein